MSMTGFLKLHRKLKENPVVMKDSDHLAVWVWLLIEAAWKPHQRLFGGKRIAVEEGQLITSALFIANELKISESKVKRILKLFESERQIEQQTTRYGRVITILRWNEYQCCDQQSERQVNDEWTTSDRRVTETEEYKEDKKNKKGNKYTDKKTERYGEFKNVLLTDDEYRKIVERFPMDYQNRIEDLSVYLKQTKRKYSSHYATILAWARKEEKEQKAKEEKQKGRMDWLDELERVHEMREADEVNLDEDGIPW